MVENARNYLFINPLAFFFVVVLGVNLIMVIDTSALLFVTISLVFFFFYLIFGVTLTSVLSDTVTGAVLEQKKNQHDLILLLKSVMDSLKRAGVLKVINASLLNFWSLLHRFYTYITVGSAKPVSCYWFLSFEVLHGTLGLSLRTLSTVNFSEQMVRWFVGSTLGAKANKLGEPDSL